MTCGPISPPRADSPPKTTDAVPPNPTPRSDPKPSWLKVRAPGGDAYHHLKQTLRALELHTVCEEARCPNVGECWRDGTATVMLLGDVCTRGCRFCAVTSGNPRGAVDAREPERVARAIASLELTYVVLTMVDRDDLPDGGADHVASTTRRLRELRPELLIEALVGDFCGRQGSVDAIADGGVDVFAHNIEVVRRLQRPVRDARCSYAQSLAVLDRVKRRWAQAGAAPGGHRFTKSSIMVGLGETDDEVVDAMCDLREAGVDVVTIGQYLRPTPKHHEVARFVPPDVFAEYEQRAVAMGFVAVASGPLVRSSHRAAEVFVRAAARGDGAAATALEDRVRAARAGGMARAAAAGASAAPIRGIARRESDAPDVPLAALAGGRRDRA